MTASNCGGVPSPVRSRLRTFHCVKLDGDDDRQCVAAASRHEALTLLIAPLSAEEACRQVASMTVRAFDAGAARLKAQGPWIYGMRANQYVDADEEDASGRPTDHALHGDIEPPKLKPLDYRPPSKATICPACGQPNRYADEDGAVDGPREYHAECWARQ